MIPRQTKWQPCIFVESIRRLLARFAFHLIRDRYFENRAGSENISPQRQRPANRGDYLICLETDYVSKRKTRTIQPWCTSKQTHVTYNYIIHPTKPGPT